MRNDREEATVLSWDTDVSTLEFAWSDDAPVAVSRVIANGAALRMLTRTPFVEVMTIASGHTASSDRLDHTHIGTCLRYVSHTLEADEHSQRIRIEQHDPTTGLTASIQVSSPHGSGAFNTTVTIQNDSELPHLLRSVTTWSSALGISLDADSNDRVDGWTLTRGSSEWLGEGRWTSTPLRELIPDVHAELAGHDRRGTYGQHSTGTWSTAAGVPLAILESERHRAAWIFQIEHNGGWRWEVGENIDNGVFSASGPTDSRHGWVCRLDPGEQFSTVPTTVALATDLISAAATMTRYRRRARRTHPDNALPAVVFNDFMNTLEGDPTTDRLLPLIDAASDVGAEIFCIDAGWYDDSGSWWGSVGEWQPSAKRFPGGLDEVIERIRSRGMVPGLWLEPEVIGVLSPLADRLPEDAFFRRHGARVEESQRYHLDLTHPAAVAHLDEVVDRLVDHFGIGYLKLDYNINPGIGTDGDTSSAGDGLLRHNRAHLAWLDSVLERHPTLIIENCASGSMRMDFAMLSRLQLQSTSDQEDYLQVPTIASSAPLAMLPEQAANWAYPQPDMTDEQIIFCLVSGLLGRFYLSGHLSRMTPQQRDLVREAVSVATELRDRIVHSEPCWPSGLPAWDAPWVSLGLRSTSGPADGLLVSIWNRGIAEAPYELALHLPAFLGRSVRVDPVFPRDLAPWSVSWDRGTAMLSVRSPTGMVAARTLLVTASAPSA